MQKRFLRGLRRAAPLLVLAVVQPGYTQSPIQAPIQAPAQGQTQATARIAEPAPPDLAPLSGELPPIPAPADIAWPGGTMRLDVDASDIVHRILRVRQTIPLAPAGTGRGKHLVLRTPQWLPGHHAPRGEIEKLAGLTFTADGRTIPWRRDPVDVFAFHLDLPADARILVVDFQYLAATDKDQGRIKVGTALMNLQWDNVSFYPAGYAVRRLPVEARVTWPTGWTDATALRGSRSGDSSTYAETDYATLIDSPVFAGRYMASHDLGQNVRLNIVADGAGDLVATPDQIARHRKLVAETLGLFGFRPFDHYDFLFAISEEMGRIGLEHQRSSENAVGPGYFTRWDGGPGDRNLLAHELVHSWNGKYRRPVGLDTPDYATPMRGALLWVYEGQTQFWGYVLGARSGLFSKDQTLDAFATIAARLDGAAGRSWRPLADTTQDPVIAARKPKGWADWQRSEDYYNEGLMVWLEVDALIRQGTGGKRGLDDFARAFFAGREGDWTISTYD
ncbi:MAG: peptidase M61, partial [Sphingobium sp.]